MVEAPQHSGLLGPLDYLCTPSPCHRAPVVRVPLGRRVVTGVVWDQSGSDPGHRPWTISTQAVAEVLDRFAALSAAWRQLIPVCRRLLPAQLGRNDLMVLPPELRQLDETQWGRRLEAPGQGP